MPLLHGLCGGTCRNKITDAARAAQIGLAMAAIARSASGGVDQTRLVTLAQHALCDPAPFSRFFAMDIDPVPRCPGTLTPASRSKAKAISRAKWSSVGPTRRVRLCHPAIPFIPTPANGQIGNFTPQRNFKSAGIAVECLYYNETVNIGCRL